LGNSLRLRQKLSMARGGKRIPKGGERLLGLGASICTNFFSLRVGPRKVQPVFRFPNGGDELGKRKLFSEGPEGRKKRGRSLRKEREKNRTTIFPTKEEEPGRGKGDTKDFFPVNPPWSEPRRRGAEFRVRRQERMKKEKGRKDEKKSS